MRCDDTPVRPRYLNILFWTALVLAVAAGWSWFSQRGVYKLSMPGTYKLVLDPANYGIWYFWKWPTKGLDERRTTIKSLRIVDPNGNIVQPKFGRDFHGPSLEFLGRQGTILSFEDIAAKGVYTVSCSEKCIVVLVPPAAQEDHGEFIWFSGAYDDFNFVSGN